MNPQTSKITHSLQYLFAIYQNTFLKEELPDLVAPKDTTKGVDIKNVIDSVLSESIPLNDWLKL